MVALSPDARRLLAIRQSLDQIAPGDWTRVHGEDGAFIEARAEMGELFVLARFDASASFEEIAFAVDAPENVRFLLRLLDAAFREIRKLKGLEPSQVDHKDYAAECAMKCAEPAFMRFLVDRHGLEAPVDRERAAQKVRSLLRVTSRKALNEGGRAADAWKALRGEFDAWWRAKR